MKKIEHDLLANKHTNIWHESEENIRFNAPSHFTVFRTTDNFPIAAVNFHEGPINEYGANGVTNEDLIVMVITRLEHFNRSEFSCRENSMVITKLEEALLWLCKRTMGREKRGVEGTNQK